MCRICQPDARYRRHVTAGRCLTGRCAGQFVTADHPVGAQARCKMPAEPELTSCSRTSAGQTELAQQRASRTARLAPGIDVPGTTRTQESSPAVKHADIGPR
jgi:hypothetical protein